MGDELEGAALGTWTLAELTKTARAEAGVGADDDLPDAIRFSANVAKLIRRRRAHPDASADLSQPAVFLLGPLPSSVVSAPTKRVPMLDNGLTPVTGRIWFVAPVVASGHYLESVAKDDDELFSTITGKLAAGRLPTIVFDPRLLVPTVRFYKNGLMDVEAYESLQVADADVALDEVLDVVAKVHRDFLVTPDAQLEQGKLWQSKPNWWPLKKAEAVIQLYLKVGLATAFPTCVIRSEQTMPEGRLDLEVERSDPLDRSLVTRYAVLELKVLRTFRESGASISASDTAAWIDEGVNQAAAYRDSKQIRRSALCCFDMRRPPRDDCFVHVATKAASLSVELRNWLLFAQSKAYREWLAARAVSS